MDLTLKRAAIPLALAAASATALAGALLANTGQAKAASSPDEAADPAVVTVAAAERFETGSLTDWATYADYVVTATVTDEKSVEAPVSETSSDKEFTGRDITIAVNDVLWRSDTATQEVPTTFTVPGWGWWPDDNGDLQEVAPEHAPRLEVGHEYVIGLVWKPEECAEGDNYPARWMAIGSDGALPADGGVIGVGELEGVVVDDSAAAARTSSTTSERGVSEVAIEFQGQHPKDLAAALAKVTPRTEDAAISALSATTSACANQ